ncbi:Putative peptidase [Olavius algarvensis Delta 1 endosymbiont]|nr:Putative peptidase [Olavius algarvensis Delta 1 endosymbiont]
MTFTVFSVLWVQVMRGRYKCMRYCSFLYFFIILSFFLNVGNAAQVSGIEKRFIDAGLVDISTIDNTIQVDLVNSNPKNNYFRENYYNGLDKAYLRKDVAIKLSNAQKVLKAKHPNYSLLILDAARPRSVSKKMYEKMKGTKFEKYVANPEKGSMHNYGIAVDITIVDENSKEIDMGFTPFRKSTLKLYWQFAKMKMGFKLNQKQAENRNLLSDTMKKAGFFPLSYEWWHFNGMPKDQARRKYKIIE